VATALMKRPEQRFRSGAEMLGALERILESSAVDDIEPAPAREPLPPQPPTDDSLALLAKQLLPIVPANQVQSILMPNNTERHVLPLPWWTQGLTFLRKLVDHVRKPATKPIESKQDTRTRDNA
jgi:hypothetical protein